MLPLPDSRRTPASAYSKHDHGQELALAPLTASDFTSAFPASCKVLVDGAGAAERDFVSNGETLRGRSSGPQGCDVREGLPSCVARRVPAVTA